MVEGVRERERERERCFDDFLGLDVRSFANERLIVFCGLSGSGKTTAIEHLLERHPAFRERRHRERDLVVLDEITRFRELPAVGDLLRRGYTVLAASHLPRWSFFLFRPFGPLACFQTDRGHDKIARYLEQAGLTFTPDALARYERAYGSVYTEIDIMLELTPDTSFDRMLRRFRKFHRIHHRPASCSPYRADNLGCRT